LKETSPSHGNHIILPFKNNGKNTHPVYIARLKWKGINIAKAYLILRARDGTEVA
jgi:hypothetical protein